jgi:hypothetical protein
MREATESRRAESRRPVVSGRCADAVIAAAHDKRNAMIVVDIVLGD